MLVKEELIGKIRDYFNLNIYETKVWLALLSKGAASASEIASMSGVPRSRTYDVLESLEKKGFAIVKLGKPVKYLGVKPKIVLEKLKNNVRNYAEEKVKSLANLTGTNEFHQLEELYNVGIHPVKREDLSASIKGRSTVSNYLKEIINSAEKEVIVFMSADEMILKERLFIDTFQSLTKKGVKVRVALSGKKELVEKLSKSIKVPTKYIEISAKFFIIDRSEVLFYLSENSSKDDQAIWLNSNFFSEAFAQLFDIAVK
ncbi:MAG: helix-turn-helix domain-containing protein [Nanoarchaeota archaeon]|nr:helix-turn-helix domain-containing protein [Nanoarchaeota archaeon]